MPGLNAVSTFIQKRCQDTVARYLASQSEKNLAAVLGCLNEVLAELNSKSLYPLQDFTAFFQENVLQPLQQAPAPSEITNSKEQGNGMPQSQNGPNNNGEACVVTQVTSALGKSSEFQNVLNQSSDIEKKNKELDNLIKSIRETQKKIIGNLHDIEKREKTPEAMDLQMLSEMENQISMNCQKLSEAVNSSKTNPNQSTQELSEEMRALSHELTNDQNVVKTLKVGVEKSLDRIKKSAIEQKAQIKSDELQAEFDKISRDAHTEAKTLKEFLDGPATEIDLGEITLQQEKIENQLSKLRQMREKISASIENVDLGPFEKSINELSLYVTETIPQAIKNAETNLGKMRETKRSEREAAQAKALIAVAQEIRTAVIDAKGDFANKIDMLDKILGNATCLQKESDYIAVINHIEMGGLIVSSNKAIKNVHDLKEAIVDHIKLRNDAPVSSRLKKEGEKILKNNNNNEDNTKKYDMKKQILDNKIQTVLQTLNQTALAITDIDKSAESVTEEKQKDVLLESLTEPKQTLDKIAKLITEIEASEALSRKYQEVNDQWIAVHKKINAIVISSLVLAPQSQITRRDSTAAFSPDVALLIKKIIGNEKFSVADEEKETETKETIAEAIGELNASTAWGHGDDAIMSLDGMTPEEILEMTQIERNIAEEIREVEASVETFRADVLKIKEKMAVLTENKKNETVFFNGEEGEAALAETQKQLKNLLKSAEQQDQELKEMIAEIGNRISRTNSVSHNKTLTSLRENLSGTSQVFGVMIKEMSTYDDHLTSLGIMLDVRFVTAEGEKIGKDISQVENELRQFRDDLLKIVSQGNAENISALLDEKTPKSLMQQKETLDNFRDRISTLLEGLHDHQGALSTTNTEEFIDLDHALSVTCGLAENNMTELQSRVAQLEEDFKRTTTLVETDFLQLAEAKFKNQAVLTEKEAQNAKDSAEIEKLNAERDAALQQITKIQDQLLKLEAAVTKTEKTATQVGVEKALIQQELDDAKRKLQTLESQNNRLSLQSGTRAELIQGLEAEKEALSKSIKSMQDLFQSTQAEKDGLSLLLLEANQKIKNQHRPPIGTEMLQQAENEAITAANERIVALQGEIAQLEKALKDLSHNEQPQSPFDKNKVERLRDKLEEANKEKDALSRETTRIIAEQKGEIKKISSTLVDTAVALESTQKTLTANEAKKKSEIDTLLSELAKATKKEERTKDSLDKISAEKMAAETAQLKLVQALKLAENEKSIHEEERKQLIVQNGLIKNQLKQETKEKGMILAQLPKAIPANVIEAVAFCKLYKGALDRMTTEFTMAFNLAGMTDKHGRQKLVAAFLTETQTWLKEQSTNLQQFLKTYPETKSLVDTLNQLLSNDLKEITLLLNNLSGSEKENQKATLQRCLLTLNNSSKALEGNDIFTARIGKLYVSAIGKSVENIQIAVGMQEGTIPSGDYQVFLQKNKAWQTDQNNLIDALKRDFSDPVLQKAADDLEKDIDVNLEAISHFFTLYSQKDITKQLANLISDFVDERKSTIEQKAVPAQSSLSQFVRPTKTDATQSKTVSVASSVDYEELFNRAYANAEAQRQSVVEREKEIEVLRAEIASLEDNSQSVLKAQRRNEREHNDNVEALKEEVKNLSGRINDSTNTAAKAIQSLQVSQREAIAAKDAEKAKLVAQLERMQDYQKWNLTMLKEAQDTVEKLREALKQQQTAALPKAIPDDVAEAVAFCKLYKGALDRMTTEFTIASKLESVTDLSARKKLAESFLTQNKNWLANEDQAWQAFLNQYPDTKTLIAVLNQSLLNNTQAIQQLFADLFSKDTRKQRMKAASLQHSLGGDVFTTRIGKLYASATGKAIENILLANEMLAGGIPKPQYEVFLQKNKDWKAEQNNLIDALERDFPDLVLKQAADDLRKGIDANLSAIEVFFTQIFSEQEKASLQYKKAVQESQIAMLKDELAQLRLDQANQKISSESDLLIPISPDLQAEIKKQAALMEGTVKQMTEGGSAFSSVSTTTIATQTDPVVKNLNTPSKAAIEQTVSSALNPSSSGRLDTESDTGSVTSEDTESFSSETDEENKQNSTGVMGALGGNTDIESDPENDTESVVTEKGDEEISDAESSTVELDEFESDEESRKKRKKSKPQSRKPSLIPSSISSAKPNPPPIVPVSGNSKRVEGKKEENPAQGKKIPLMRLYKSHGLLSPKNNNIGKFHPKDSFDINEAFKIIFGIQFSAPDFRLQFNEKEIEAMHKPDGLLQTTDQGYAFRITCDKKETEFKLELRDNEALMIEGDTLENQQQRLMKTMVCMVSTLVTASKELTFFGSNAMMVTAGILYAMKLKDKGLSDLTFKIIGKDGAAKKVPDMNIYLVQLQKENPEMFKQANQFVNNLQIDNVEEEKFFVEAQKMHASTSLNSRLRP